MGSIINSVADIFGVGPASQQQKGVESAAAASQASANQSLALQREMFNKQIELQEPWRQAGVNALTKMNLGEYSQTPQFAFNYNQNTDPGTQFRLQQGLNAMNASAAARGGLISGNALKAGQTFGQEMGSQEYQNSFNRYLQNYANAPNTFQLNRNNLLDPLKFLTNVGQAGASNQAANVGSFGAANAANTMGAANAQAAGQIGSANAYSNAIGQGIGQYNYNSMLNRFAPQSQSAYNIGGAGSDPTYGAGNAYGNMTGGEISNMQQYGV